MLNLPWREPPRGILDPRTRPADNKAWGGDGQPTDIPPRKGEDVVNRTISIIVLAVCLLLPAGASASWIPEVEPLDPSVLEGDPEFPYGIQPVQFEHSTTSLRANDTPQAEAPRRSLWNRALQTLWSWVWILS
jgi:hypothetical protein